MDIEKVKISDLVFDPSNVRIHGKKNLRSIKGSLAKFKQQKPIVVDKKNVVVAGNGTLQMAISLGWKDIFIVRTDLEGADATAFSIADNRTSELAEWDKEGLGTALKSLADTDYDLPAIGFDIEDWNSEEGKKGTDGLTDPDDVPEVEDNPYEVLRGDIWTLGNHRLMCGDSCDINDVEKLINNEIIKNVFADPPYNLNIKYNSYEDKKPREEYEKFSKQWFFNLKANNIIITPGTPNIAMWCQIKEPEHIGAWIKKNWVTSCSIAQLQQWEPIFYYGKFDIKRMSDIFEINRRVQKDVGKDHPCPKQIEFMLDVLSQFEGSIYDPFLGSGSTLIACEKTGRKCFGMEFDPHYCSVIIKRWEEFSGKKATKGG